MGIDNRNGIMLAAKHKGTIMGRPIKLIIEDDEGKTETGIRKAEKLVFKDKVVVLTGVAFSNVGLAIAGEMDRLNVPFLTTNVMTPKFYGMHPLLFRCGQLTDDQTAVAHAVGIAKAKELSGRQYYVLADDYAWGHSCAEEFIKIATEKEIRIEPHLRQRCAQRHRLVSLCQQDRRKRRGRNVLLPAVSHHSAVHGTGFQVRPDEKNQDRGRGLTQRSRS